MGIEDWKNPVDQSGAKEARKEIKKNKKLSEEEKISRRKFLKIGAASVGSLGAGYLTGTAINKGLEKAMDYFAEDEKVEDEVEEVEEVEKRELVGAEKIAQEILDTYNLPALQRRIDPNVFTKDFYMAQQFQESRGRANVESRSEAKGVYQNKADSVVEVVKYLNFLREKTADRPVNERVDYLGPESITMEEADEISDYFKIVADYGRATGKLYLQAIHDPESRFNNKPNRDVFRGKTPEEQQKILLIAYHDGPKKRLNPEGASQNGKNYVEYVFRHMETIDDLRNRFEKAGMSRDLDYAIIKIMRELERGENRNTEKETTRREDAINSFIKKLQDAHMKKWKMTGDVEERISNDEIREIFG